MMRKIIILMLMAVAATCGRAEVKDAFKGILPVTDPTMRKSLNGDWSLKVVKGITDDRKVPAADDSWGTIPVPGCWEAYDFCEPKYDYPDSLTGYYRTEFTVPDEWQGQQVVLRLDGVLRGYDLWLNDRYVGSWESAYNTCLFNLTPYLHPSGSQQLAMRVYTRFKGYEFDCFDDWAANGIFRDVTLMAVPRTHLSDLTIHTKNTGEVSVDVSIVNETKGVTVRHEILDAQGRVVGTDKVENPHLWTAETPYLYTLRTTLLQKGKALQTFEHRFGFREISIEGNVLKLNGQPIKLRGVNAHATDPRTVKVISDELTLKDMRMMKEASVNYMRLSHYPREPRFYELADSLGFYLVDEVPFGYGDKHLSDRSYQDILLTRAQATIARDKNHPSVLIWSVGNENPLPQTCVEVGDYVGRLDPSRPYCFPQVGSYFRRFFEGKDAKGFPSQAPVYAPHYPTTGQIGGFYQHLDRPVIFTEYCHTLGISFEDHDRQWEIIERTPGIAGGSVWEWADQGMPFGSEKAHPHHPTPKNQHPTPNTQVYTSKDGGFDMYGNKGADGLVYADRTPLPNYYELQHNYARAFVSSVNCDSVAVSLTLVNRYDFLNLKDNITFHWVLTADRDTIARGAFSPDCPPHQTVVYPLSIFNGQIVNSQCSMVNGQRTMVNGQCSMVNGQCSKICLLNIEISDAQGYIFNRQSVPLNPKNLTERILSGLTVSTANAMSRVQEGPLIRAGRKATMAEALKVGDKRLERYLIPLSTDNGQSSIVNGQIENGQIANSQIVKYHLTPDTTDTFLSELGIAFLLDQQIDRVQWIGNGPYPTYPGRYRAGRYGFWALQQGDLYFEGNRQGVDAAWLTDKNGNGLLLVCNNANVNFEQTDRGIVLTVNAAVAGQGPKFARTAFPVIAKDVGTLSGDFWLYRTDATQLPEILRTLFAEPQTIPPPFRPFETQYDTYLMKYEDIIDNSQIINSQIVK